MFGTASLAGPVNLSSNNCKILRFAVKIGPDWLDASCFICVDSCTQKDINSFNFMMMMMMSYLPLERRERLEVKRKLKNKI